jgi:hypothetical protein
MEYINHINFLPKNIFVIDNVETRVYNVITYNIDSLFSLELQ